ncbi:hypothetical protein BH11ARM2_BH11ARM2_26470 [soil metagenome]
MGRLRSPLVWGIAVLGTLSVVAILSVVHGRHPKEGKRWSVVPLPSLGWDDFPYDRFELGAYDQGVQIQVFDTEGRQEEEHFSQASHQVTPDGQMFVEPAPPRPISAGDYPEGEYLVVAKPRSGLRQRIRMRIKDGKVRYNHPFRFVLGDLNGDDRIDAKDLALTKHYLGLQVDMYGRMTLPDGRISLVLLKSSLSDNAVFTERAELADLNEDGVVNGEDVRIVEANLGKQGD